MAEVPLIFPQGEEDDVFDEFDPFDDIQLSDTAVEDPRPYGFTWTYDFTKGDLDFSRGDPVKVTKVDVVNQWILHTTNTEKLEVDSLGESVGTNLFSLFGSAIDPYILSRVEEELTDALLVHDRIEEIDFISAFSIKNDVYAYVAYVTDDLLSGQSLLQLR